MTNQTTLMKPLFGLSGSDDPFPGATEIDVKMAVADSPLMMQAMSIEQAPDMSLPNSPGKDNELDNSLENTKKFDYTPGFQPKM